MITALSHADVHENMDALFGFYADVTPNTRYRNKIFFVLSPREMA